jgi:hypothetical protein
MPGSLTPGIAAVIKFNHFCARYFSQLSGASLTHTAFIFAQVARVSLRGCELSNRENLPTLVRPGWIIGGCLG